MLKGNNLRIVKDDDYYQLFRGETEIDSVLRHSTGHYRGKYTGSSSGYVFHNQKAWKEFWEKELSK